MPSRIGGRGVHVPEEIEGTRWAKKISCVISPWLIGSPEIIGLYDDRFRLGMDEDGQSYGSQRTSRKLRGGVADNHSIEPLRKFACSKLFAFRIRREM